MMERRLSTTNCCCPNSGTAVIPTALRLPFQVQARPVQALTANLGGNSAAAKGPGLRGVPLTSTGTNQEWQGYRRLSLTLVCWSVKRRLMQT